MNENLKPITTLRPFTRFIYTLGALPTSYLMSMTYEEQLIWLCNYISQTVIPALNNNGLAIEELQEKYIELKSFIDNYFENLDVQEEINNKLDEMADDGTLENIISEYIQLQTTYTYNNVATMKEATNLVNGSFARTSGFYSYNDDGGALYKVRTVTNEDVVDERFIIALSDNTLVAELLFNNELNIKQIGAKGDNSTDDSAIVQAGINKLSSIGGNLIFPKSIYLFESGITIPVNNELINIIGNDSSFIFTNSTGNAFTCVATGDDVCRVTFNDLRILYDGTGEDIIGIKIQKVTDRKIINNVRISGFYDNIWIKNCWFLIFDKLISVQATHDGFFCEDIVNAFNFNSCIFQYNTRFNFLLTGRGHILNNCDFSIYNNTSQNKFFGVDGASLNGCYYEESNNPSRPFVFQTCNGISLNGCYFELTSTDSDYRLIDFNNSWGMGVINCYFKANSVVEDDDGYIIYLREGATVSLECNRFKNLKKVCYTTNSSLTINNNSLSTVTSFITQDNSSYARISGNMQTTSDYNACTLPRKDVAHINIMNLLSFGNTANRPDGYYTGQTYYNTQTNHLDIYNGSTWQTS